MNAVNELLNSLNGSTRLHYDTWTKERAFYGIGNAHNKKWIGNILPCELLKRTLKRTVDSIVTLSESEIFFKNFPENIQTPNYGDNWGRFANYIEINNRAIAEMGSPDNPSLCRNGLISTIKLLPAIPPSSKSWANCIILSQIFPNIYGDGYNKPVWEENSVYGLKLNGDYSENIISSKISAETQWKAFNDLAHFRGIKTGFRIMISEDQIKITHPYQEDENFRWHNKEHEEIFINECVKLINYGFEAIFFDSAKHIGGYDCGNYTGVGALPEYHQMQYLLNEIRRRSGRSDLSFVGEKSSIDFERYQNMGLTAGTAFVPVDNFETVKHWSDKLKYNRTYAPGAEVSNDNDTGGRSYEERLERLKTCFFAYTYPSDKLPSFMQMEDLFPLRYDTNTHQLMMTNPSYSLDGTPLSHWENLFTKEDGRNYNRQVGEIFAYALNMV